MNAIAKEPKSEVCTPNSSNCEAIREYITPGVNVFESREGYTVEAEIPGVSKDGLKITLEGNELTILARRTTVAEEAQAIYRESSPADYRRVFELDPAIDSSRISARVEQGLLTLHLPKFESVKPRQITVTG